MNFGDATQFVGNGFVTSPAAQPRMGSSPEGKGKPNNSLRAVTIKQLFEATSQAVDDTYRLDGIELNDVTLVGKVAAVGSSNSLDLSVTLDDGTGQLEMRYWLEDDTEAQRADCQPGAYVRAHGQLRSFEGRVTLQAFNVRPITDFNEVTYHCLSSIFQHLHLTKGKALGGTGGGTMAGATAPQQQQAGFGGMHAATATNNNGYTPVQADTMAFFNAAESGRTDGGVSLDEALRALGGRYAPDAIMAAIDFLTNEGHVYTTIDDKHFKSCAT